MLHVLLSKPMRYFPPYNPHPTGFSSVGMVVLSLVVCFFLTVSAEGQEKLNADGDGQFSELLGNSPFLRRVNLSQELVLTGVAYIEGKQVAILVDRKTDETHFVGQEKSDNGWRLLGIEGELEDIDSISARLVVGEEEVSIAYDSRQINPEQQVGRAVPSEHLRSVTHEARNFHRGMSADGYGNPPPKHVIDRFSKLNENQRMRIIYEMRQHSAAGKGTRERQQIFDGLVNRALRQRR